MSTINRWLMGLLDTLLLLGAILLVGWGLTSSSLSAFQGTQAEVAGIFLLLLAWYFREGRGDRLL